MLAPAMGLAEQMERTNRGMIAFDLVLGTGALLARGGAHGRGAAR